MIPQDPRITEFLATPFEKKLYAACIENANSPSGLRLSNFAFAMRELVRTVFDRLSPDTDVSSCSWFVQEHQRPGAATGAQKAKFAIQGGLADDYIAEDLSLDLSAVIADYGKAIRALSKFTHVQPDVFDFPESLVDKKIEYTNDAVGTLFETVRVLHERLVSALWEHIDRAVIEEALSETIQAFDEAATHHSIEEVGVEVVEIVRIGPESIYLRASGWITAELQWGSNSDVRRGDGAIGSLTSGFECGLMSSVDNPDDVDVDESSLQVDEAPWREEP